MKQYERGRTQPLLRMGHDQGKTSVSKPKGLKQILIMIIMKHNTLSLLQQNNPNLNCQNIKHLRQSNYWRILNKNTKIWAPQNIHKNIGPSKNIGALKIFGGC